VQARIAAALGVDTHGLSEAEAAGRAADAVADLIAQLGLPRHLAAYGLTEDDLVEAARPIATDACSLDDLVGILRAAW
jgi:alcohol dehydrogenase